MVGGTGGGFDSPAGGLYPRLAQDLPHHRIVRSGSATGTRPILWSPTVDAILGMRYLESQGVSAVGLVGHSLGGAVVIQAAANDPKVRAVVVISTPGGRDRTGCPAPERSGNPHDPR